MLQKETAEPVQQSLSGAITASQKESTTPQPSSPASMAAMITGGDRFRPISPTRISSSDSPGGQVSSISVRQNGINSALTRTIRLLQKRAPLCQGRESETGHRPSRLCPSEYQRTWNESGLSPPPTKWCDIYALIDKSYNLIPMLR